MGIFVIVYLNIDNYLRKPDMSLIKKTLLDIRFWIILFFAATCPIFARPPAGPLAQISSGTDPAGEFRGEIEGAKTIEVSFRKTAPPLPSAILFEKILLVK